MLDGADTSLSPGSHSDYVRLHITPLDRELLAMAVPAAVLPSARNVSFHTVETFPEKRFGFVDLPRADADRLRKRLHGAVLRGSKLRIEPARPEARIEPARDAPALGEKRPGRGHGPERAKRPRWDPDVLQGVTLKNRKVKRGWTESAEAKRKHRTSKDRDKDKDKDKDRRGRSRAKSKYTDKEECLLKVKLPPNAAGNLPREDAPRKSGRKSGRRELTVHEFERTTQFPSFLRHAAAETTAKPATGFVEGKGWVDEDGNVVEAVAARARAAGARGRNASAEGESDDSTSSSGTSSEDEDEDEEEKDAEEQDEEAPTERRPAMGRGDDGPPAGPRPPQGAAHATTTRSAPRPSASPRPSPRPPGGTTPAAPPQPAPKPPAVHPLEALYKRPPRAEPFSFFGGAARDTPPPETPFARRDPERRGVRSAALGRDEDDDDADDDGIGNDDDDDDGGGDGEPRHGVEAQAPDRSDFQAWFWDNRRDLNRSWMARRKTAAKERRHRENASRASKAV